MTNKKKEKQTEEELVSEFTNDMGKVKDNPILSDDFYKQIGKGLESNSHLVEVVEKKLAEDMEEAMQDPNFAPDDPSFPSTSAPLMPLPGPDGKIFDPSTHWRNALKTFPKPDVGMVAKELDINYEDELAEMHKHNAQLAAAEAMKPLVEAQALPLIYLCHISLKVNGFNKLQIQKIADAVIFVINESVHGEYNGQEEHAGELCIHFAASSKDEVISDFAKNDIVANHFLSLSWLNTSTKEHKKEWSLI